MFVRTGDEVKVITGKEEGKEGTVIRVDRKNGRVAVKDLNIIRKRERPSQINQNGDVVGKEGSIHVSDVILIDLESGKPTRISHEIVDGDKARIARVNGKAIDREQRGES